MSVEPVRSKTGISEIADVLSKGVAALAIGVYGCGFLIVSLHDSRFGFTETNPFRPKILAAGTWFLIFTSIPVAIAIGLGRNWFSWRRFAGFLYPYYFACLSFSFLATRLFDTTAGVNASIPLKWVVVGLIAFVILLVLTDYKKGPAIVPIVSSVLLATLLISFDLRQILLHHVFDIENIAMWFFAVGIFTILEVHVRLRKFADAYEAVWKVAKTLTPILIALLVFASYYYPRMKSSWGGGSPIDVILFFNKDSAIKPNQTVSAQLIDESDAGFYVLGQGETRAIFIPRSSVALVYFSDKADSSLLK